MKKRFLILLMAFVSAAVFAQASLDPNDRFYQDAKNWETKKIISWLPQVRPYPAKTIRKILETVKEKGTTIIEYLSSPNNTLYSALNKIVSKERDKNPV